MPPDEFQHGYPRWECLKELRLTNEWIRPGWLAFTLKGMKSLEKVILLLSGVNELF